MFIGGAFHVNAQFPGTFKIDSGVYQDLSNPISLNNGQSWDDPEYLMPIGFPFQFFGQQFDSLIVSDYISFDDNTTYIINVLYADLVDRDTATSVSPIGYVLDGDSLKRILKVEWQNAGYYCENGGEPPMNDYMNVQLWLYELTGDIEIHVGPSSIDDPIIAYCGEEGPIVELRAPGINYSLVGAPDACVLSNASSNLSGVPGDGLIYRFLKCLTATASYSYTVDSGNVISFQNTSANELGYYWDFGDSTTSAQANPSHQYAQSGMYQVTFVAIGNCNTDTIVENISASEVGIAMQPADAGKRLIMYPNPSSERIVVRMVSERAPKQLLLWDDVPFSVVDMYGRTVLSGWFDHRLLNGRTSVVKIGDLSSGLYHLSIQLSEGYLSKGFVKY